MKILPYRTKIQIEVDTPTAGSLDTSSLTVAKEKGTVVSIGKVFADVCPDLKVGDEIFFKAWAVDIIHDEGEKYYFIDVDTKGLCGIIKKK